MLRKHIASNSKEVILPFFSTLSSGSTEPLQCCIQFWAFQDKGDGDSDTVKTRGNGQILKWWLDMVLGYLLLLTLAKKHLVR